jgi:hypothetical protein
MGASAPIDLAETWLADQAEKVVNSIPDHMSQPSATGVALCLWCVPLFPEMSRAGHVSGEGTV